MKTRTFVSILILVLAVLIISEGDATEKRITKRDYKFVSDTWINEEYNSRAILAKYELHRDGTYDSYNKTSDAGKMYTGHYQIIDKWTDSEGNIWYKMHFWFGSILEDHPNYYELAKFSKSGKVWESIDGKFEFPTELDESHVKYDIYYRQ